MHIAAQSKPPFLQADHHRFEAPLEQVSAAIMPAIEPDTVAQVQPLRRPAQIGLAQFQDQMIMIVHQYIAMQADVETRNHFGQELAKMLPVALVAENGTAFVASGGQMIPAAGLFDAKGSSHERGSNAARRQRQLLNIKM